MNELSEYLPIIIPLAVIQFALMITALVHILRHKVYRFGKREVWILLVLFMGIIGPIVYFLFGRGED